ncbi:hypothetical protein [Pseudobdellovibrio sp. HCB154]|uniref:hypothetical protein n=1 Tax=Pseudobdellovibrio sp. HCB154 TaxID=3386277 RepID=UPI00391702C9
MKATVIAIILLIQINSFAKEAKMKLPSHIPNPSIAVAETKTGEMTYLVLGADGKTKQVSMSFFTDNLEKAIEAAKKAVCVLKVLPQSITISSVVVSVTYEPTQFCPERKD